MKAVCKIIRDAGAEDILVAAGLFQEGTAKKMFGISAVFWSIFLEMSDILHRFIYYQREGYWAGDLCESARMLPYLTAAGHYKYGQQSLRLYLSEMKKLPETAPEAHEALMAGAFVGRRADGNHNGVSPDMLLEQTYNADAKEASGLDGITLNRAARMKWVYIKPPTAAISAELKSTLHLYSSSPHHESGWSRVNRDAEMVVKVMAAVETNPFTTATPSLINISTGEGFGVIAERYRHLLLIDVPPGTDIIHLCCDRYSTTSLKSAEQEQRYARSKPAKVYEVSEQYTALGPKEFFAVSANKANLLSFHCQKWCADEQLEPGLGPTHLYLGGGFKEETVVLTAWSVMDVPALESTQQEADTRIFLHTFYSVQNEGVDRVVVCQ
ncbi:hypothetical protein JOQ06_026376 [Pogonophryne albipinna]|uniref:Uncharacterized protein n=1 Tax=Pogonophryne albipinna TaxID=1090488 RepID=A0AAD6B8I8_9TELE|nr:hypothetical protein JOQ06_026376 [Pogonophryne albipinna]